MIKYASSEAYASKVVTAIERSCPDPNASWVLSV